MSLPLSKKIQKKRRMPQYLKELELLIGRRVNEEELSSVEDAEKMRNEFLKIHETETTSFEVSFSDKSTDRFQNFLEKLSDANPSSVHVWTEWTISCGVLTISSLMDFRADFSFTINQNGVLTFVTSDLCDRLMFDFWLTDSNEERLAIETQGKHWRDIIY